MKRKKSRPDRKPGDLDAGKPAHELEAAKVKLKMQKDELRRAVAEAKEARDLYSEMYDSAPVGYLTLDVKGKVLQANFAAASLLDIPRATLVGGRFQAFLAPGGIPEFRELLDSSFAGSGNGIGDLPILISAGITRWVHVVLSPAAKGCCRVFATDVTESRRMEERLRSSEVYLKEAQSLGHTESFRFDFETEAVTLSEEACRLLEIDRPTGVISLPQIRSLIPHGEWERLCAAAFAAAKVRENMDTLATITRPDGSSRVFHLITAVRVSAKGRLLEIVGTVRDITEEKRAWEALRESQRRYQTLLESIQEGIWAIDARGVTTFVNPSLARMLKYPVEEMIGKPFFDFMSEENKPRARMYLELRLKGISEHHEFTFRRGDGTCVYTELSASPLRDAEGSITGALATVVDVTEQRTIEEAYRSLVENSIQGFAIMQEGRIVFCNEALARMSGYTREESYRMSAEEVAATVHPEDRDRVMTGMREILGGRGPLPGQQIRILNKKGEAHWVEVLASLTTFNSKPALQVSYMDVTERREAEAALHESEARFRTLIEKAPVAIGISRQGSIVYANCAFQRMFGFEDAGELIGRPIADQIAPRLREEAMERALRRSRGLPAETEYESVGLRKDGTEFPIRAAVTVLDLADGPASVGFIADISAQKEFEQKLGDSHARLRNLATHLLSVREAERKSVAREIHDELGQLLTALKMDLRWIEKQLGSSGHNVLEKIEGTLGLVDQAIDIVHRISSNLRPGMLDDLGLATAIEWLGAEFSQRTGISCDATVTIPEFRIGGNSTTTLFRIVQEALSNIGQHSGASHASILIRESGGRLEVTIEDDGIGITMEQAAASTSFGLIGMRERVEGLRGQLTVRGQEGKGTTVHATIPLPAEGGLA